MHACDTYNLNAANLIKAGQSHIAALKSACSSVQLHKATKELCTVLERLLAAESKTDQKSKTACFIESFNAAYESLSGGSHDRIRLLAALKTANLALRGLKQSRDVIKGRKFEVEIQQYSLIRRLVALKSYTEVRQLVEVFP